MTLKYVLKAFEAGAPPRSPLGELTTLLQTPLARPGGLQWGWGCSGGLGAKPPAGSRGRAPGQGGEDPLKLKSFEPSEDRGSWQICHPVKYSENCSNIHGLRSVSPPLLFEVEGTPRVLSFYYFGNRFFVMHSTDCRRSDSAKNVTRIG